MMVERAIRSVIQEAQKDDEKSRFVGQLVLPFLLRTVLLFLFGIGLGVFNFEPDDEKIVVNEHASNAEFSSVQPAKAEGSDKNIVSPKIVEHNHEKNFQTGKISPIQTSNRWQFLDFTTRLVKIEG